MNEHQMAAEAADNYFDNWHAPLNKESLTAIIQSAIEKALKHQGDDYATMDDARNRILDLERDLAACRRAAPRERWLKSARALAKLWAADDRRWTTQQEVECSLLSFASSLSGSQPAHVSGLEQYDTGLI